MIRSFKVETLRKLDFLVLFRNLSELRGTGRLLNKCKEFLPLTHRRTLSATDLLLDVLGLNRSTVLPARIRFALEVHFCGGMVQYRWEILG